MQQSLKKGALFLLGLLLFFITVKAALGAVVINEFLADPLVVTDNNGEYIELYNDGSTAVDLLNWVINDSGSDSHTIATSLVIPANDFLVLCRNNNLTQNGNLACDYLYGIDISLTNTADEIMLYDSTSTLVDNVTYDTANGWSIQAGTSLELIDVSADNNVPTNWELAQTKLGGAPRYVVNVDAADPVKGDPSAPVTIVQFCDFEGPFCGQWYSNTLPSIETQYINTNQVKLVYKDFP